MSATILRAPTMERRSQDSNIASLSMQIGILQAQISSVNENMEKMSQAITKLAVIEERMVAATNQQDRAFEMIREIRTEYTRSKNDLEERLEKLEVQQPVKDLVASWFLAGVWAVVGAAALYISKKVGLLWKLAKTALI